MRSKSIVLAVTLSASLGVAAQTSTAARPASPPLPPLALPTGPGPDLLLPLPAPGPALDLTALLKDSSLCIAQFIKNPPDASKSDRASLDSIQKIFVDVARESLQSKLLKDVVQIGESKCAVHDAACFAAVGKLARCQNVLVGSSEAKSNGYAMSVRLYDVNKGKVAPGSVVEQVLETDSTAEVQAWAEGQACRALNVKCAGKVRVDADRKDFRIYVNERLAPRSFRAPEEILVEPGVHLVHVAIDQRRSPTKKVAVRRNAVSDLMYARQTEKGAVLLLGSKELLGGSPARSADFEQGGWTKPVGLAVTAAGLVAAGFGVYEASHGKSLLNTATNSYAANGGAYTQADLGNISSGRSAVRTGNAMFVVAGVLVAAGLVLTFAF